VIDFSLRWQVIHGDCLDVMRQLPDGCVDAVVTDPPYCSGSVGESQRVAAKGQGLRSENVRRMGWFTGDNMGTAGLMFLLRFVAFEATRVAKPSGSFLAFCDWRMAPNIIPAIESAGLRYQNLIVWDKGHFGLGRGFRAQHELVAQFSFGSPEYHDASCGNVIRAGRVTADEREHQTEKPTELMARLLKVVAPSDGIVLDPFCGSGSTGVAAIQNGYRFIGIEREASYVDIARRRIADAAAQGNLFQEAR
jgi:DNA modification methylase